MPDKDEAAIEAAFYEEECPYFFSVDWSEDDADIVMYCSDCLNLDSLHAEQQDDVLVIFHNDRKRIVPLAYDDGDRDVTIRALNNVLLPNQEIRFLVCSRGNDTMGFVVLSEHDWESLDSDLTQAVNENFIKHQIRAASKNFHRDD